LLVSEAISVAGRPLDQLRAQYRRVERVRALPIADVDHAMIEFCRNGQVISPYQPERKLKTDKTQNRAHTSKSRQLSASSGGFAQAARSQSVRCTNGIIRFTAPVDPTHPAMVLAAPHTHANAQWSCDK
jgi:hypothetical protein